MTLSLATLDEISLVDWINQKAYPKTDTNYPDVYIYPLATSVKESDIIVDGEKQTVSFISLANNKLVYIANGNHALEFEFRFVPFGPGPFSSKGEQIINWVLMTLVFDK